MTLCVFLFLFNNAEGFQNNAHRCSQNHVASFFFYKVPLVKSTGVLDTVYHTQRYQLSGFRPTCSPAHKILSVCDWVIYELTPTSRDMRCLTTGILEFITNLMHNFIYSIIILHHYPQHVSSIAVLIFSRTILYLQYLVSSHTVWQHTEWDDTRYCKYTIVLLKLSTAMLETC
jgi:tryptophan-rich sensory protein